MYISLFCVVFWLSRRTALRTFIGQMATFWVSFLTIRRFIVWRENLWALEEGKERCSIRGQGEAERYTLDEALGAFIKAKEAEGVRPRTIDDYRQYVKYLKVFLNEYGNEINDISEFTAKIIREYVIYMRQTKKAYEGINKREKEIAGLSVNTINIRLRTLKTMCNFWFKERIFKINPISNIKQVKDDEQKRGTRIK
jgi:hypothetical protein